MAQPRPFKISIPDHELNLLRQKLELTRLPDEPEGYTLQQGVPVAKMQHMLRHWKDDYLPKWRQHEAKLNELPMFTLPVETDGFGSLDIHFIHARSERANATPLLFVHGWPGSFLEVTKMLEGLTNPPDDSLQAFHVVAPSLPNYGFSEGVKKRGFNLRHYGYVLNNLMLDLGYNQYVSQGGDWGSIITRKMGRHHSQHLRGIHVNLAVFDWWNLLKKPWLFLLALIWPPFWPSRKSFDGLRRAYRYVVDGNAYYQMQATRPQTVAFCLEDSPAGLLGWIYEKLLHWTDNYPWTEDEVLTWVSIYWFSRAGPGASVRTYFEAEHPSRDWGGVPSDKRFWDYTEPKLGISQFPKDVAGIPDFTTKTLGPVVYRNWPKVGGHFASWEQPGILVQDVRAMFSVGGPAYPAIGIEK